MAGLIVHEWVEGHGGSERVVDELIRAFPDSGLLALWDDTSGRFFDDIQETWLAKTALRRKKALAVPILPSVWRNVQPTGHYDWLLVSSHLFAHHVKLRRQPELSKLVYAHTPARYIWEPETDGRGAGIVPRAASLMLKPIDRRRAAEATAVAANSEFTRARIERTWGRTSEVIYPPVDTETIIAGGEWARSLSAEDLSRLQQLPSSFLLGASRFVPYKRLDLVIAAGEATQMPVVLAGSGSDDARLHHLAAAASVPVHFVIAPSDELLLALYQAAEVFVFPAVEDFGIMPIEAMAAGTPVIVQPQGGAAESARLLSGGVTLDGLTPDAWVRAMERVYSIDRATLPKRTLRFSQARFRSEIQSWLKDHIVKTGGKP